VNEPHHCKFDLSSELQNPSVDKGVVWCGVVWCGGGVVGVWQVVRRSSREFSFQMEPFPPEKLAGRGGVRGSRSRSRRGW
jgi:hypothetical protein